MKEALSLAEKAYAEGEIPVGAVIVRNGQIVGRGYNKCESMKNPLLHAEIVAIDEAASVVGDWRLAGVADIYPAVGDGDFRNLL